MLGEVGGVKEKEGRIGSSGKGHGRGRALWLRGGLCDAVAGRLGQFESRNQPLPKWETFLHFSLSACLPCPTPFSCKVYFSLPYLAQSLLIRCNSVQEENVSFFI